MKRKSIAILLCLSMILTLFVSSEQSMAKKVKPKLNKKKVTLYVGKSVRLKVKGTKKKVKWKSSSKKVATVSSKGKVKARKAGKTRITAKFGKKKLVCRVTVKNKKAGTSTVPKPSEAVLVTASPQPSAGAQASAIPQGSFGPQQSAGAAESDKPRETAGAEPSSGPQQSESSRPQQSAGVAESDKPQETTEVEQSAKPQQSAGAQTSAGPHVSSEPQASETPRVPELSKQASFENGTEGFKAQGNADIEVVDGGYQGKCLQVSNRTAASDGVVYEAGGEVAAGEGYTVQGYAKVGNGSGTLKCMYRTGDGEDCVHELLVVQVSGEWVKFMGTITVPEDFAKLDIWFELSDSTDTFYMDEVSITEIVSIKDTYDSIFGKMGTCINIDQLEDPEILKYVKKHYSSLTLENGMKPGYIMQGWMPLISREEAKAKTGDYVIPDNYEEEKVPQFDFTTVDKALKMAKENGFKIRYHVLMWHSQSPEWFFKEDYSKDSGAAYVSAEKMYARMEMSIRSMIHHVYTLDDGAYRDVVYTWDVANEYFSNTPDKNWSAVFGNREGNLGNRPPFIKRAFEIAYDELEKYSLADSVSLFYNDYNTYMNTDEIIELIHYINSDRKLCRGIGMQTHLAVDFPSVDSYIRTLHRFVREGFEVQITELDVICVDPDERPDETIEEAYENQAKYVGELAEKLVAYQKASDHAITSLTWWGLYDDVSWRKESHVLMFGKGLHDAKPAYFAFMKAASSGAPNPTPTPGVPAVPTPPVPNETPKYTPPAQTASPVAIYDFSDESSYKNELPEGAASVVNEDGSITLTFTKQYAAFNFYLPDNAQNYYSNYKSVALTYTSEGGDLGHALYDVNMQGKDGDSSAGKHPDWGQRIKESANGERIIVLAVSDSDSPTDPNNPYIGGCVRGLQIFNPNELADGKTITITIKSLRFCDKENPTDEDLGQEDLPMEPGTYRFMNSYTYGYEEGIIAYKNGIKQNNVEIKTYSGENDDPFTPESEQPWDAESLLLTPGLTYTTEDGVVHPITSMLTNWNLCADPTSIDNSDVDGKLYVYGTTEGVDYEDGEMVINGYNNHSLTIMSTKDMVNWTDEGFMDNKNLTNQPESVTGKVNCKWSGGKAWAPSGLKIDGDGDGKDEYYLFYTDGGAVGYVQGESPTGPWKDDLGVALFTRDTPNCSGVEWCFDPAVLVDDKGDAYVYFGGGLPQDKAVAHPKTGRVAKIKFEQGTGKVLLDGDPQEMDTYYFFEDGEINQFHGKYFYSYCTNFLVPGIVEAPGALGPIGAGQIACYVSSDPMNIVFDPEKQQSTDSLKYLGTILSNPSSIYGKSYNNHHHMLTFKGREYITYHSTALENMMYHTAKDYRCLHVDEIEVDKDTDQISITPTYKGASQIENFNPYETINATTTSYSAGVKSSKSDAVHAMVLDKIHTGDWTKISGVDFGEKGAAAVAAKITSSTNNGAIEIFIDDPTVAANRIASLNMKTTGEETYDMVQTEIEEKLTGVHDVYFVFRGSGYKVASWEFTESK